MTEELKPIERFLHKRIFTWPMLLLASTGMILSSLIDSAGLKILTFTATLATIVIVQTTIDKGMKR